MKFHGKTAPLRLSERPYPIVSSGILSAGTFSVRAKVMPVDSGEK
jgi:hypothetical protein